MRGRWAALVCSSLVVGCDKPATAPAAPSAISTTPPVITDVEPPPGINVGEFVVALPGTTLYTERDGRQPVLKVGGEGRGFWPLALRVQAIEGDMVRVTPVNDDAHCGVRLRGYEWAALELWVRRRALPPVLREAFALEFGDGTQVALAPGTALRDDGMQALLPITSATGPTMLEVPLEIPRSFTAPSYVAPIDTASEARPEGMIEVGGKVRLGGKPFVAPAGAFVTVVSPRGSGALAAVEGRCGLVVLATEPSELRDPDKVDTSWGEVTRDRVQGPFTVHRPAKGLSLPDIEVLTVPKGTEIVWRSSKRAGTVRGPKQFVGAATSTGTTACFAPDRLQAWFHPDVRLCFAEKTVAMAVVPAIEVEGLSDASNQVNAYGPRYGGYGRGSGAGFGGRGKRVPRVRQAKAKVQGALDKDIIRRIVRAHINEVRYCYNQGLKRDPKLKGRIEVSFTINGKGKVPRAKVVSSSLSDDAVAKCVASAMRRWKFPKPGGGKSVNVSYPFVLEPG